MLAYLTIVTTSLAGLAGFDPIAIIPGALILTAISAAMHRDIYVGAWNRGLVGRHMAASTLAGSVCTGLAACGAAWVLGYGLRMI